MSNNFEVTGLKTGSTSKAGYCFCATAQKDNIHLIAVIMDAPDYKVRFSEAQKLLNYGYANCSYYEDTTPPILDELPVEKGVQDAVHLAYERSFSYVSFKNEDLSSITSEIHLEESLTAPFESNTPAGYIEYFLEGHSIGKVDIVTSMSVEKAGFKDYLLKIYGNFIAIC
jgi:D-alanyl-D-alanine carboxypeptidase (penicillin-binding protein 5/6)